jgi:hypothetical protein
MKGATDILQQELATGTQSRDKTLVLIKPTKLHLRRLIEGLQLVL